MNMSGGYGAVVFRNNPRSNKNSGSSSNTTTLPCTLHNDSYTYYYGIGNAQAANQRLSTYTPPSNSYGSGKTEF